MMLVNRTFKFGILTPGHVIINRPSLQNSNMCAFFLTTFLIIGNSFKWHSVRGVWKSFGSEHSSLFIPDPDQGVAAVCRWWKWNWVSIKLFTTVKLIGEVMFLTYELKDMSSILTQFLEWFSFKTLFITTSILLNL